MDRPLPPANPFATPDVPRDVEPASSSAEPRKRADANAPGADAAVIRWRAAQQALVAYDQTEAIRRAPYLRAKADKYAFDPLTHPQAKANPFVQPLASRSGIDKVRYLWPDNSDLVFRRGPRVARGGYTKVYDVFDQHGQAYVMRLLHLDAQRGLAFGRKEKVHVTGIELLARELGAMRAIGSPLLPKHVFHYTRPEGDRDVTKLMWLVEPMDGDLQRLRDLTPTPPSAAVMRHVTRALVTQLARLHRGGYVHRDLKPENVLYRRGGTIVLADFGLAGKLPLPASERVTGTPGYKAPEAYVPVAGSATLDQRSDSYALGLTLSALAFPEAHRAFPLAFYYDPPPGVERVEGRPFGWRNPQYDDANEVVDTMVAWQRAAATRPSAPALAAFQARYPEETRGITGLLRAWNALDPALTTLVFGEMLHVHPDVRPSLEQLQQGLGRLGDAAQAQADAVAAAHYFDALVGFQSTDRQDAGRLRREELRLVPRLPAELLA